MNMADYLILRAPGGRGRAADQTHQTIGILGNGCQWSDGDRRGSREGEGVSRSSMGHAAHGIRHIRRRRHTRTIDISLR